MIKLSRSQRRRLRKLGPAPRPENEGYVVFGDEEVTPEDLHEVCKYTFNYAEVPTWKNDPSYNWRVPRKRSKP